MQTLIKSIETFISNTYSFCCGVFASVLGFFVPIKDIVHLMIFFFVLDVIFGYWKAAKLHNEKFNVKIIWEHTIPRMLISIVLVLCAYMWDITFKVEFVSTYKIICWFISGVLLYSIAENGYKITNWNVFHGIGKLFQKKIEEQTGLNLQQNEKKSDSVN